MRALLLILDHIGRNCRWMAWAFGVPIDPRIRNPDPNRGFEPERTGDAHHRL